MAEPAPRRGEVWSAYTPGQPDDPHQPRFVLVVSADARNRARDDAFVVPIFSRGDPGPTRVVLPVGRTGLRHGSVLYCDEVTTIAREFLVGGPHGRVPRQILDAMVLAVRRALGDFSA